MIIKVKMIEDQSIYVFIRIFEYRFTTMREINVFLSYNFF